MAIAFAAVGLDWRDWVVSDSSLFRPTDLAVGQGNAEKANQRLSWKARYKTKDVVGMMCNRQDLI